MNPYNNTNLNLKVFHKVMSIFKNAICSGHIDIFHNTWGHTSPHKNVSYKGKVRFTLTDHSEYGCQPIILLYDFKNLEGPYIHDFLFEDICNWNKHKELETGVIYERTLTFRNYRFYYGKIMKVLNSMEL